MYAVFTSPDATQPVICGRRDCKIKTFPPGTELEYIQSAHPDQAGRFVCKECCAYYAVKMAAIVKDETVGRSSIVPKQSVQAMIAQAQQGRASHIVQAVGTSYNVGMPPRMVPAQSGMPPPMVPAQSRGNSYQPAVYVPGQHLHPMRPPAINQPVPPEHIGAVHALLANKMAKQAYKGLSEVVTVESRLGHITKTTKTVIGGIVEAIQDVPAHIGAPELKQLAFGALAPRWEDYSQGFPLRIEDVILRNHHWAHLTSETDAIYVQFLKEGKDGIKKFRTGKCIIWLDIPAKVFNLFEDWDKAKKNGQAVDPRPDLQAAALIVDHDVGNHVTRALFTQAHATPNPAQDRALDDPEIEIVGTNLKKRERVLSKQNVKVSFPSMSLVDLEVQVPENNHNQKSGMIIGGPDLAYDSAPKSPTKKRIRSETPKALVPIDPEQLLRAIRGQHRPSKKEIKKKLYHEAVNVNLYSVRKRTLADIMENFDSLTNIDWDHPQQSTLYVNWDPELQISGTFKIASFGTTEVPLFGGSTDICIKQAFTTKTRNVPNKAGRMVPVEQKVVLDRQGQLMSLVTEINCLVWSQGLQEMTDQYVDQEIVIRGKPPMDVPKFRFVNAALAIERQGASGLGGIAGGRVFLVEELISPNTEGPFRKYIHNNSAISSYFEDRDDENRADFLVFAQHLQYWQTGRLLFVTDFQGGNSLLTDPQLVTKAALGDLFAAGNLPETHAAFEREHLCNKFCEFFGLPPPAECPDKTGENLSIQVSVANIAGPSRVTGHRTRGAIVPMEISVETGA